MGGPFAVEWANAISLNIRRKSTLKIGEEKRKEKCKNCGKCDKEKLIMGQRI